MFTDKRVKKYQVRCGSQKHSIHIVDRARFWDAFVEKFQLQPVKYALKYYFPLMNKWKNVDDPEKLPAQAKVVVPYENCKPFEPKEPEKKARTPRQHGLSPRQHVLSPRQLVLSPRQQVLSPRQQVLSPRQQVLSPRRQVLSPRPVVQNKISEKKNLSSPQGTKGVELEEVESGLPTSARRYIDFVSDEPRSLPSPKDKPKTRKDESNLEGAGKENQLLGNTNKAKYVELQCRMSDSEDESLPDLDVQYDKVKMRQRRRSSDSSASSFGCDKSSDGSSTENLKLMRRSVNNSCSSLSISSIGSEGSNTGEFKLKKKSYYSNSSSSSLSSIGSASSHSQGWKSKRKSYEFNVSSLSLSTTGIKGSTEELKSKKNSSDYSSDLSLSSKDSECCPCVMCTQSTSEPAFTKDSKDGLHPSLATEADGASGQPTSPEAATGVERMDLDSHTETEKQRTCEDVEEDEYAPKPLPGNGTEYDLDLEDSLFISYETRSKLMKQDRATLIPLTKPQRREVIDSVYMDVAENYKKFYPSHLEYTNMCHSLLERYPALDVERGSVYAFVSAMKNRFTIMRRKYHAHVPAVREKSQIHQERMKNSSLSKQHEDKDTTSSAFDGDLTSCTDHHFSWQKPSLLKPVLQPVYMQLFQQQTLDVPAPTDNEDQEALTYRKIREMVRRTVGNENEENQWEMYSFTQAMETLQPDC